MNKRFLFPALLILCVLILSCGCCLTGKKKAPNPEPFQGPSPVNPATSNELIQPPVPKEAVPVKVNYNPNGEQIPGGGITSPSNYATEQTCPNADACNTTLINTNVSPGTALQQGSNSTIVTPPSTPQTPGQSGVLLVTPSNTALPSNTSPQAKGSSITTSNETSRQVDKPVVAPESNKPSIQSPAPPVIAPPPAGPTTNPPPSSVGKFDYAKKEESSSSDPDAFRQVSEESNSDKGQPAQTPQSTPALKPKGRTVSLEKEIQKQTPSAAVPDKKDTNATKDAAVSKNATDSKKENNLGVNTESSMEYNGEYPDGGDLTRSRPTGTYMEETPRPKYARGYTDPPAVNPMGQKNLFVSPGVYGETRLNIRIQAVP